VYEHATQGVSMTITLKSSAFDAGQPIPEKYTGDGEDRSPPLNWSGMPEGTKQLALICDDPDAPSSDPWVHWVIYNLPAEHTSLPEGIAHSKRLKEPAGAVQGANSWPSGQTVGYRGPAPPPGKPHRYYFKLYALDIDLDLQPELSKNELLQAMRDHILTEGQLMGTYQR
jgi:Raf kinase inhibitor-like YbhB/YbcL family protein